MSTEPPPSKHQRDPYPRMIIVCIVITLTLFLLIATVLTIDIALRSRSEQRVQPSSPNFFKPVQAPELPPAEGAL